MKKMIVIFSVLAFFTPLLAGAHGSATEFESIQTGPGMMRYIEDTVLGDELHEEMEDLMLKMMAGNLTQPEARRISEVMGQYPGPMGMMMNRFSGMGWGSGWGMMPWLGVGFGLTSFLLWLFVICAAVWTIVGVLAVIWLWQQISSDKKR